MARLRDLLRTSFLERSPRLIGAIGLSALLVGSASALLLTGGAFARTYKVTAYFSDAAGIRPGDEVTVAGLKAGTVKSLRIDDGRVAMVLGVNKGVQLPTDSRAAVVVQTLLGKRTVSLIAGSSSQQLTSGWAIPIDHTTTPVDITELNDISVNLLQHSDAQALNELMAEVTKVTSGKAGQVRLVVSGLADVAQAVDARRIQLGRLITSLTTLSTTLGEKDQTIVSLIDNLNPVLSNLGQRQQAIQTLLQATDAASHDTADLVIRNRKVLDQTLQGLHEDLLVIDQHQVDLAETVSYLSQAVQGYASVGYSGGDCGTRPPACNPGAPNRWASIFVQSLGPVGVDAILGQCGAVDQLIDKVLGTNCQKEGSIARQPPGGLHGSGGPGGSLPRLPHVPTPSLSPPPQPPVPTPPIPLPSLTLGPGTQQDGSGDPSLGSFDAMGMPNGIDALIELALAGWGGPS